jgi:hypothetical protein
MCIRIKVHPNWLKLKLIGRLGHLQRPDTFLLQIMFLHDLDYLCWVADKKRCKFWPLLGLGVGPALQHIFLKHNIDIKIYYII